ncbi:phytanoyl-CoA dioxygenase family protein [Paenibacillus mendelii]|uniref:Phytanoyl-CoA dioxygenase family protein n=1 Tax=Paenibacillus mendelii TaxID=206163 RepID=A0ABV6JBV3_9BACL|nr:phytanoyl-CoA dioxygenase family protein [Paenibacillus mendelii]MCQ6558623.1 phytanoyl-CoA dioxygenase family protein [Paenibacillus mendelii]
MEQTNPDLNMRLKAFKEQGYTIFKNVYDQDTMASWIRKHKQLQEDSLVKQQWWFANTCELAPKLMLPAVNNPLILDFAEMVMGPYVQLDNLTLAGFPSISKQEAENKVSGWHRDRWAHVPLGEDYTHPLSINAISYLQDLTDEYGPLRIIPGSHRKEIVLKDEERGIPHQDEVVVHMSAGDVVVTHNGLLHSGTPNTSGNIRYFFSVYYNRTWLKHTDNHNGPNVQEIIRKARANNDHRLLRLFGVDDHLQARANSGFLQADEVRWAEWAAADKAAIVKK